jgi:hypothetical protein
MLLVGTFDENRATVPLTKKYIKSFQRSFLISSIIVFSFEGIRNSVYTNLHGILQNSAELNIKKFRGIKRNYAELCGIKPIPYKIPYSAEFQNGTSENTLRRTLLSGVSDPAGHCSGGYQTPQDIVLRCIRLRRTSV